jgi:bacillithiol biosynthesis cysteine-adding enzyme BshC
MKPEVIPFERYAGLNPLFLAFLRKRPAFFPDPPALEAATERARELLGRSAKVSAAAFRFRGAEAAKQAEALSKGQAVAVVTGHQVGLFSGPLYTLVKAWDAIRVAREISARGVPAVPVFYALTDDHDLEEIAKTARPTEEGPQVLVLEGADRANRHPVGELPIPERVTEILAAFQEDAKTPEAREILEAFARRSAPGHPYGGAFIETLLDLIEEPLLVLDASVSEARPAAADLFAQAAAKREEIERVLAQAEQAVQRDGYPVPVPHRPGVFPFFLVEKGERRRVDDLDRASKLITSGQAWVSADVLTRPVLKSFLLPAAASILGPAEIAYHAQALPLFPIFGLRPPVLLPRSHVVWIGPVERRAARALGVETRDLLADRTEAAPRLPEGEQLDQIARDADAGLAGLEESIQKIDPTLSGALETTRRKISYQIGQMREKMEKAAERKDEVTGRRRRLLETRVRPAGAAADRLYPPLVPLLTRGRDVLAAIREGATGSTEGVAVVDLAPTPEGTQETVHAG